MAYLPHTGVVLAQLAVERRENEIVAVPKLLGRLDLTGVVVVGDVMQTRRALSRQIVETGGDYIWFLKDNQPGMLADVQQLFDQPHLAKGWSEPETDFAQARMLNKGHRRLEERIITVSAMLEGYVDWPYLVQVFRLERRVWAQGKQTSEVRYGITSLPKQVASAQRLIELARVEWSIENRLHYRRAVTLEEDACQVRIGTAAQVLAALNNTVIGLFPLAGKHNLAAAQRAFAYDFDKLISRSSLTV